MGGKIAGDGTRLSREQILEIAGEVSAWLDAPVIICGSFRREKEDSGDVDLVVPGECLDYEDKLVERWGRHKNHNPKRTGEVMGAQVDLMFATPAQMPAALLASTGSGEFNRAMRSIAKQEGLKLNHEGLFDRETGIPVPVKEESDIFEELGVAFIRPCDRNGFEEVNKARKVFKETRYATK